MTQSVPPGLAAAWLDPGSFGESVNNPQWPGYKQYQDIFDAASPAIGPGHQSQFENPQFYNDWVTPRTVPDPQGLNRPVIAF